MLNVIIIGAGIAGASAAAVLAEAGWNVHLLDKAGKAGGRCATRRTAADLSSPWFDYGAQYFTAHDPAFRAVVDRDLANGRLQRWQPAICVAARSGCHWQLAPSPDARERLIAPTGLNHWVRHRLEQIDATVQCHARVAGITATTDGWRVDIDDDPVARHADALIITAPAPQAATLLGGVARDMPALANAGQALRACHSLVVEAPGLADCHGLFVKDGIVSWIADNTHKAGLDDARRHLWTLHATPDFSDADVEGKPAAVQSLLVDEFAAITGIDHADIRPVHGHRWRYARPGGGAPDADALCHVDAERRFALAGDWLAGGRVEGAWLSGRTAALALIEG